MRSSRFLIISSLLLCSCAGPKEFGGDPSLEIYRAAALPVPTGVDFIGPFDKLSINVFGIEELSVQEVQADSSGRISIPLVGTLDAQGKTPEQLASEIEAALRGQHVRDPRVAVNLKDAMNRIVTVGGEVKEPGAYPATKDMTLLTAIARAKGATEFSRLEEVVLFRTVEGQRFAALYNVAAIQRGAYEDPRVYPNDIVMVGDSPARRLFKNVLQTAPALLSPLVYVFRP